MDAAQLWSWIFDFGTHGLEYFQSNWDPVKAVMIAFTALSSLAGIYIKWRNSGYRLHNRLDEFLAQQEHRLDDSRRQLAELFEHPAPGRLEEKPSFNSKSLTRTLRKMNWGFGLAGSNELGSAARTTAEQVKLSRKMTKEHQNRQALAHMLLGAREASRPVADPAKRAEFRSRALDHFNKALELNAKDADALEYSAMMMLELLNAPEALDRFNRLVKLREKDGGIALARAYRLVATASMKLARPRCRPAVSALNAALQHIPGDAPLTRAAILEQLGDVRKCWEVYDAASQSYQQAWAIYRRLPSLAAAQEGARRVKTAIDDISILQSKEDDASGASQS